MPSIASPIEPSAPRAAPSVAVLSTLFPSAAEPVAGVFIRERMFRVARHLPVTVVSPQPWFPGQGILRRWRPHYRPQRADFEVMDGVEVHRPRYLAVPGLMRRLDGWSIAVAVRPLLEKLKRDGRADILDVHFGYPDGYAGHLLARWLALPYLVTLRGKEERMRHTPSLAKRMSVALAAADRVVSVSGALRRVGIDLGADESRSVLIGNGIDLEKFRPVARAEARERLGVPADAQVLVSVGGLVERKGFHRVIECLPDLLKSHPRLLLLVVGGAGPEGDYSAVLRRLTQERGLQDQVRFLGPMAPADLHVPLSAADVFVLATRYEGWANVLLEAMACGLPVVTTDVGGNAEVVCQPELGLIVPFGNAERLGSALGSALNRDWDRQAIRAYAEENAWDRRIDQLLRLIRDMARPAAAPLRVESPTTA